MRSPSCAPLAAVLLFACGLVPASADAQSAIPTAAALRSEPIVPEKVGKELQAVYVGQTPPHIDGRLDDEAWQTAQAIDDMVQNDPDNMKPPTERTSVKVLYDDRSVYVGVINYMSDPTRSPTRLGGATRFRAATRSRSRSIRATITSPPTRSIRIPPACRAT